MSHASADSLKKDAASLTAVPAVKITGGLPSAINFSSSGEIGFLSDSSKNRKFVTSVFFGQSG